MDHRRFGFSPRRYFARAVVCIGIVALSACAVSAYRPKGPSDATGYTDEQVSANRYRVTFSGNVGTQRDKVEAFLLRRAAEITLQAGFDYFILDTHEVEATTSYQAPVEEPDLMLGPTIGGLRSWRFSNLNSGDDGLVPLTRYTAYAEVVLLTSAQAANRANAISAHEVTDRLTPPADHPPST